MTTPMFPLGTVLFPTMVLPLHVFETRYRALVRDCLDHDLEFGVTLIERGSEVGGGDVRSSIGCLARIVDVRELPDGRFAVIAVGTERVSVDRWLDDDRYPRAEVRPLSDTAARDDLAERHQANVTLLRRCLALSAELGEATPAATTELSDDIVVAGYQACALAPLGPADRYRLLAEPGPSERAERLHSLLAEQRAMLQLRMSELSAPPQ
jgi:Lon protease-like protein